MNILVLSTMFPCKRHPTSAVFFANLMKELAPRVDNLIVVTPRVYVPKFLTRFNKKWAKWYLDPMRSRENEMDIIRPYYLSLRGMSYGALNGMLMQYSLFNLLRTVIKENKIELILGYNMIPDGIAAVRLAKMFKLPVGFWAIGTDVNDYARYNRINHYLTKRCIEDSQIIFTESQDLENEIRQLSTKPLNVKTFYKGIDISSFQNLPPNNTLFELLKLTPDKRYILFVGRLIYDKGIYELVRAFSHIADQYSNMHLIMIGEETEKDKLTIKFSEEGLLNRVTFTGILPHKQIAYYMKVSDILVLPTWAEGLPNVLMEAMSIGLPVVSTDVGGIPEILDNGVTGLSVPAKNVEKLTEAMIRMIEDDELRELCIKNAQKLIINKFDVNKNVLTLHEILQGMISNYYVTQN